MQFFKNSRGKLILNHMIKAVQENKVYLGEVDGLIGDGDHGMNMNKGFSLFGARIEKEEITFSEGLAKLGFILMEEIGGSMGPIYGTIFTEIAGCMDNEGKEEIGLEDFARYLEAGLNGLYEIVEAKIGDKTLVDALAPAVAVLKSDMEKKTDFNIALENMKAAAEKGKESTKDMIAKFGRSSRLGERSRGVLDAGSCSCAIILQAIADGISEILQ